MVLSLGSNLGNKEENLKQALKFLEKLPINFQKISNIYINPAWGFESPHLFFNLIAVGKTSFSPWALIFEIKKIETLMGRKKRKKNYEDRIIDIDIIFYENYIIEGQILKIPHPLAHQRDFVLFPALEIIPDWIHPVFKKSIKEIYESLKIENL
nr:2-amino-4-hydroxy-6-hydroxymethyldihydropteridine diphosphokinase [Thermodesulfobacterium hydrogeniphilum]